MNVDTDSFRALTAQVAELAARVEQVAQQAAMVRTLDEMRLERSGYTLPRKRTGARPRHLRSVDGGAS